MMIGKCSEVNEYMNQNVKGQGHLAFVRLNLTAFP